MAEDTIDKYGIDQNELDDDMTSQFMVARTEVHADVKTNLDMAHEEYLKEKEPQKPEATAGRVAEGAWQELKHSPANFAASARSYLENELSRTTDPESKKNFEELIGKVSEFEESEAFQMSEEFEGQSSGFFEDVARGVTGSLPDMALTIAAPPVGMAAMFAHIQGSSYTSISKNLEAEFPDMDPEKRRKRAYYSSAANAAIQTPLELVGNLFKIKGVLGKTGFVKRLVGLAESALGEGFTEFIQQFPDEFATAWAMNPDLSSEELQEHLGNIKYDILKKAGYAGAVGAAAGTATTGAGQVAVDMANMISPKQKEINEQRNDLIRAKLANGEKITEEDISRHSETMSVGDRVVTAAVYELSGTQLSHVSTEEDADGNKVETVKIEKGVGKGTTFSVDKLTIENVQDGFYKKVAEIERESGAVHGRISKEHEVLTEQDKKRLKEFVKEGEVIENTKIVDDIDNETPSNVHLLYEGEDKLEDGTSYHVVTVVKDGKTTIMTPTEVTKESIRIELAELTVLQDELLSRTEQEAERKANFPALTSIKGGKEITHESRGFYTEENIDESLLNVGKPQSEIDEMNKQGLTLKEKVNELKKGGWYAEKKPPPVDKKGKRSKERVKRLGEVMTPPALVEEMLDKFPPEKWSDPTLTVLEPAAGHGNFVLGVLNRKLKHLKAENKLDRLYQALNTVFAVEIDQHNADEMKERVRELAHNYLKDNKVEITDEIKKNIDGVLDHNIIIDDFLREGIGKELLDKPFFLQTEGLDESGHKISDGGYTLLSELIPEKKRLEELNIKEMPGPPIIDRQYFEDQVGIDMGARSTEELAEAKEQREFRIDKISNKSENYKGGIQTFEPGEYTKEELEKMSDEELDKVFDEVMEQRKFKKWKLDKHKVNALKRMNWSQNDIDNMSKEEQYDAYENDKFKMGKVTRKAFISIVKKLGRTNEEIKNMTDAELTTAAVLGRDPEEVRKDIVEHFEIFLKGKGYTTEQWNKLNLSEREKVVKGRFTQLGNESREIYEQYLDASKYNFDGTIKKTKEEREFEFKQKIRDNFLQQAIKDGKIPPGTTLEQYDARRKELGVESISVVDMKEEEAGTTKDVGMEEVSPEDIDTLPPVEDGIPIEELDMVEGDWTYTKEDVIEEDDIIDLTDVVEPIIEEHDKQEAQKEAFVYDAGKYKIDQDIQPEEVKEQYIDRGVIGYDANGNLNLQDFNSVEELIGAKKAISEERTEQGVPVPPVEESIKELSEIHNMTEEELISKINDTTKTNSAKLMHDELLNAKASEAWMKQKLDEYLAKTATNVLDDATMFSAIAKQQLIRGEFLNDETAIMRASKILKVAGTKEDVMDALNQLYENVKIKAEDRKLLAQTFRLMKSHQINERFSKMGKVGFADVAIEYWINGLLSNPATHAVNFISNSLAAIWMIPERYLGAISHAVRKHLFRIESKFDIQNPQGNINPSQMEIEFGEANALFFGFFNGITDIWKLVRESRSDFTPKGIHEKVMNPETDTHIQDTKLESRQSFKALSAHGYNDTVASLIDTLTLGKVDAEVNLSGVLAGIMNYVGAIFRIPGSLLLLSDKVFRETIGYRMELNALAYRQASAEGLEGEALSQRINDIRSDPVANGAAHLDEAAKQQANYQTFVNKLGKTGQGMEQAINSNKFLKVIIPFFRTPANIVKFGMSRTVLAAIPGASSFYADIKAGGARGDLAIARILTGSAVSAAVFMYGMNSVTGGGPADSDLRKLKRNQGWQPYSIKVGDKYYAYSRIEPFGMWLGMTADLTDAYGEVKKEEYEKAVMGVLLAMANNITSKTWLRGVSEFINFYTEPERYSEDYIINFVSTWTPMSSGLAQWSRVKDPTIKDIRMRERDMKFTHEWFYKWWDTVKTRLPIDRDSVNSFSNTPRLNMWGEKIVLGGGWGPDMISPFYTSDTKVSPVDAELYRLGVEDNRHFVMPRNIIKIHNTDIELTAPEYDIYVKAMNQRGIIERGKTLKETMNGLVKSFNKKGRVYPDEIRHMIITKYFEAARAQAKEILYKNVLSVKEYIDKGIREREKELNSART